MGERYLDVVLQKPDVDLFKELFRLYPLAEVEDYFKGGQWQRELLKMDIQAIFAHREEAGAPEAPPLEEIALPPLPNQPTPNATISLMPLDVKLANGDGETQVILKPQAAVNGMVVPPKAKAMPPQLAASIPKRPEGQVVLPPAQIAAATQPAVAATPTPLPVGTVAPRAPLNPLRPSADLATAAKRPRLDVPAVLPKPAVTATAAAAVPSIVPAAAGTVASRAPARPMASLAQMLAPGPVPPAARAPGPVPPAARAAMVAPPGGVAPRPRGATVPVRPR